MSLQTRPTESITRCKRRILFGEGIILSMSSDEPQDHQNTSKASAKFEGWDRGGRITGGIFVDT